VKETKVIAGIDGKVSPLPQENKIEASKKSMGMYFL
jgi:hypothetical protein